jgi:hypothetical protein
MLGSVLRLFPHFLALAYFLPWLFFRGAEIIAFKLVDVAVTACSACVLAKVFNWSVGGKNALPATVLAIVLMVTLHIDVVSVQTPDPSAFTGRGKAPLLRLPTDNLKAPA